MRSPSLRSPANHTQLRPSLHHRRPHLPHLTLATLSTLFGSFASAQQAGHSAQGRHQISSKDNFVILDGEQAQLFRLLGVLPFLQTIAAQVVLLALTLVAVTISAWFLLAKRSSRSAGSADRFSIIFPLPDSLDRLLFYLHFETTSYLNALLEEIMALVNAPLGLGLTLASRFSGRTTGRSASTGFSEPSAASGTYHGRGRRRRHDPSQANGTASSGSKAATSGTDGKYYPGLWNTGNSCFLNSTLQSLASVDGIQALLESIISEAEQWDVPTPVTDALYDLVIQLNTPSSSRSATIPRQLTDALSSRPQNNVGSFFYAHQQQDAHELLVLVTSALDDEMNAIIAEKNTALRAQSAGLRAVFAPPAQPAQSSAKPMANPFRALIAQRTACLDCGYVEAVRHYPADELSLTVPPRAGSATTIEACLLNWSKLEVVDWICFRCSLIRTLDRVRAEVSYLVSVANGALSPTGSNNGQPLTASAKKKSGAKRRRVREMKVKEDVLVEILKSGYSEDEIDATKMLEKHEIKLDRTFSRAATKQVMLARTPRVLVLHLNRSSYSASNFGASKNNAAVLFDEHLDLADVVTGGDLNVSGDKPISRGATPSLHEAQEESWFVQGKRIQAPANGSFGPAQTDDGYLDHKIVVQDNTMKTRYRLCAIVVHYGGHSSGHYVAFRRRRSRLRALGNSPGLHGDEEDAIDGILDGWPSSTGSKGRSGEDQWYRISDDNVSRCSLRDVLTQNPFLLFYERIGDEADNVFRTTTSIGTSTHLAGLTNGQQCQDGRSTHQNGHSETRVPQGFESFARLHDPQMRRTPYTPRIIQRWETMPFERMLNKDHSLKKRTDMSVPQEDVTQNKGDSRPSQ